MQLQAALLPGVVYGGPAGVGLAVAVIDVRQANDVPGAYVQVCWQV